MYRLARWISLLLAAGMLAGCASTPSSKKYPPLPEVPVVLIIGDSISMESSGYLPGVVKGLGSRLRVIHNPDNGGDSANVLAHLDEWVSAAQPDIIHFNCGLHDIKFDRQRLTRQQEPKDYERNLREIVRKLKTETKARLIFALTTPVNEERHRAQRPFYRRQADVELYNAIARRVMTENNIPVNDLYKVLMDAGPDKCLSQDGVHMLGPGNAVLAEAVASAIEQLAGRQSEK